MDKTDKILQTLKSRPQDLTPVATDMFIPNNSGMQAISKTDTILWIDKPNRRVGIGTTTPLVALHIATGGVIRTYNAGNTTYASTSASGFSFSSGGSFTDGVLYMTVSALFKVYDGVTSRTRLALNNSSVATNSAVTISGFPSGGSQTDIAYFINNGNMQMNTGIIQQNSSVSYNNGTDTITNGTLLMKIGNAIYFFDGASGAGNLRRIIGTSAGGVIQIGNAPTVIITGVTIDGGTNGKILLNSVGTGFVGVGTATVPSMLTVAGLINMKGYTVATLPAGTQGDIAYVTDALAPTFLVAIAGGGAVVCPVFFDGTNWVAH